MARRKAKAAAAPIYAANDPTPERMTRSMIVSVEAPLMLGETRTKAMTMLILSPVKRWHQTGWIDDAGFVAMHNYESLVEACGYARSRSCLDFSPKGEGGIPPSVLVSRDRRASLSFAARFYCDAGAWSYVEAVLQPYGAEGEDDVAERMLPRMGRDRRRDQRRAWVADAAQALVEVMG